MVTVRSVFGLEKSEPKGPLSECFRFSKLMIQLKLCMDC
jgi:hypothetical protein